VSHSETAIRFQLNQFLNWPDAKSGPPSKKWNFRLSALLWQKSLRPLIALHQRHQKKGAALLEQRLQEGISLMNLLVRTTIDIFLSLSL
jgi:hypothetical protein